MCLFYHTIYLSDEKPGVSVHQNIDICLYLLTYFITFFNIR